MTSQNAYFTGAVAPDAELEHPPGAPIARKLRAEMATPGWTAGEIDGWRDSGWSIGFRQGEREVALVVAAADGTGGAWALQIAPARVPGLVGRALGKAASATPDDVLELARAAHAVLARDGRFQGLRWLWDGYADDPAAAPEPDAG